MRKFVIAAAVAACMAGPALASTPPAQPTSQPETSPPAPDAKKDEKDPNRLVCKRERVVGTNRREKVCRTVAEIERERDAAIARGRNSRGTDYNKCIGGPGR